MYTRRRSKFSHRNLSIYWADLHQIFRIGRGVWGASLSVHSFRESIRFGDSGRAESIRLDCRISSE